MGTDSGIELVRFHTVVVDMIAAGIVAPFDTVVDKNYHPLHHHHNKAVDMAVDTIVDTIVGMVVDKVVDKVADTIDKVVGMVVDTHHNHHRSLQNHQFLNTVIL